MAHLHSSCVAEVEKELGKKSKKLTLGPIQQAPELPTKTRTLRRHADSRDGDSPGKPISPSIPSESEVLPD